VIVLKKEAEKRLGRKLRGKARSYYLLSSDGTRNLGGPYSRRQAIDRERQVQYCKRLRSNPSGRRVAFTPSTFELFYFSEYGLEPGDIGTVIGSSRDPENDTMVEWDGKGQVAVPSAALRNATARNPEEPQLPAKRRKVEEVPVERIPPGWEKMWPMYLPPKTQLPVKVGDVGRLIEGRRPEDHTFHDESPEFQAELLDRLREMARLREIEMKRWEKEQEQREMSQNPYVTSAMGNPPVNPKAYEMRDRYRDDLAAGHSDAAEYWRGQAAAYFTGNPPPGWKILKIKDVIIHVDQEYQLRYMSDWNRLWELVNDGYITPFGEGPAKYGQMKFYFTGRIAQNPYVTSAMGSHYAPNPSQEPGAMQRIAEGVAVAGLSALGLKAFGIAPNPSSLTYDQAKSKLHEMGFLLKKSRGRHEKQAYLRSSRYIIIPQNRPTTRIGAKNLETVNEFIIVMSRGMPRYIGGSY